MNIIYLISCILVFLCVFFIKKSESELNGVSWFIYLIGIFLAFNLCTVFFLYFIKIKSSLFMLSIINILIIGLIYFVSFKKNKKFVFQKYYYNKFEIFGLIFLIFVTIIISLTRFDFLNDIKYETTDPTVHFKTAETFAKSESLLDVNNSQDSIYGNFSYSMTGSYINGGIFIKVLSFLPAYIAFIIFDIFCYVFSAVLFFVTINEFKKKKSKNILSLLIAVLYIIGYPLNNMIFGFFYLGIGVAYINLSLLTIIMFNNIKDIKLKYIFYGFLSLANYALFFSYYLFVPFTYLAEGLYFICLWITKKNSFKETIIKCLITLVLPFIIGFSYFILPGFFATSELGAINAITAEGYIYRNLWSNFILFIPFVIFTFIYQIKNKKITVDCIVLIVLLLFIVLVLYLGMRGKASSYYFYKLYYPLWLIIFIYMCNSIFEKESWAFTVTQIFLILAVFGISCMKIESKITQKNVNFNPTETSTISNKLVNLYAWNLNKVFEKNTILDLGELKIIEEYDEKYRDICGSNEIPTVGNYLEKLWIYSITDVVPIYDHKDLQLYDFYYKSFDFDLWEKDKNSKCLIYLNNSNEKIDSSKYNKIYENDSGYILSK